MIVRGRKAWMVFHRWMGIVLGVVIALIGISGAVLVFEHEIDVALHGELLRVEPQAQRLPFDAIVQAAADAHPGEAPYYFQRRSDDPRESFKVVLRDAARTERAVYINPYTGAVLGELPKDTPLTLARRIHGDLLAGEPVGSTFVGVLSFLCIAFFAAGLVLWWPAKGGWRGALTVRGGGGTRRTMRELHNVFGSWLAIFFIIASVTVPPLVWMGSTDGGPAPGGGGQAAGGPPRGGAGGAPAGGPAGERPAGGPPGGERPSGPPPDAAAPPVPAQPMSWEDAAAFAAKEAPGQYVGFILRQDGPRGIYMVRFWPEGTTGVEKQSNIIMPLAGGRIIRAQRPEPFTLASITKTSFAANIHSGAIAGLAGRIIMFLAALCFPVLFGTGVVMWWMGRKRTAEA